MARRAARILVVEDEEDFRNCILLVLRKQGHSAHGESDGRRALDRLASEHFDLLVLDVLLPGMTGLELLECARETHPRELPPVLVMSALRSPKTQEPFLRTFLGVSAFLPKPVDLATFQATVGRLLQGRGIEIPVAREAGADRSSERGDGARREAEGRPSADQSDFDVLAQKSRETLAPAARARKPRPFSYRFQSPSHFLREFVDNIGHGGLFIPTEEAAEVGDRLALRIEIPSRSGGSREVSVDAEVVLTRCPPNLLGVGVQFLALTPEAQRVLEAAVDDAQRDARPLRPLLVLHYALPALAEPLQRALPDTELHVRTAATLPELEEASLEAPDLVLVSATGNGESAARAVTALRARREAPRLYIIAAGDASAATAVTDAGANGFFVLPAESDALLARVRTELSVRRHVRARFRGEVELHVAGVVVYAEGLDVCEGGIAASAPASLREGQAVETRFSLPDGEPPIRLPCHVAWRRESPHGRSVRYGFTFHEPSGEIAARLRRYVREGIRLSNFVRFLSAAGTRGS